VFQFDERLKSQIGEKLKKRFKKNKDVKERINWKITLTFVAFKSEG